MRAARLGPRSWSAGSSSRSPSDGNFSRARRPSRDQGCCLDWITRLALAHPGVKIKVSAGEAMLLNVPAVKDLSERIALALGRDFRGLLIPAAGEREGARLQGFVSRPEFTRSNAAQMYFYVNQRFVKDYLLNHAAMTAYRRVIEARRYPAVVLDLEVPPGEVDVNVHPTKMEVRFRDPRGIYALIVETIGSAIGAGFPSNREVETSGGADAGRMGYSGRVEEALRRYRVTSGPGKLLFERSDRKMAAPSLTPLLREGVSARVEEPKRGTCFSDLAYLGQVAGTYLVFDGEEGMVLVDQHAAHERVLFEGLKRRSAETGERGIGQRLLIPEVVSLPPRDFTFLSQSIPILEEAGMEVEPFGGDSVVVKALPAFLPPGEAKTIIGDLLADCGEADRNLTLTEIRERVFTALACRGAVKAHRTMTPPEVAALCRDLDAVSHAATCPHGRPVAVPLSAFELERMFKRR